MSMFIYSTASYSYDSPEEAHTLVTRADEAEMVFVTSILLSESSLVQVRTPRREGGLVVPRLDRTFSWQALAKFKPEWVEWKWQNLWQ